MIQGTSAGFVLTVILLGILLAIPSSNPSAATEFAESLADHDTFGTSTADQDAINHENLDINYFGISGSDSFGMILQNEVSATTQVTKIIFTSDRDGASLGENYEVYIMDSDGSNVRRVTPNPGPDWTQGWSGDGKWLLTASEYEGNWDVYLIEIDGKALMGLTCLPEAARYPSWWWPVTN